MSPGQQPRCTPAAFAPLRACQPFRVTRRPTSCSLWRCGTGSCCRQTQPLTAAAASCSQTGCPPACWSSRRQSSPARPSAAAPAGQLRGATPSLTAPGRCGTWGGCHVYNALDSGALRTGRRQWCAGEGAPAWCTPRLASLSLQPPAVQGGCDVGSTYANLTVLQHRECLLLSQGLSAVETGRPVVAIPTPGLIGGAPVTLRCALCCHTRLPAACAPPLAC